jgi:(S)-2-hydroxyglutarate dehydrogenase
LQNGESLESGYFVNAAGLDSLRLAHQEGLAHKYAMLPLKGRYAISKDASAGDRFKMLVYPVPVKGAFALGVHSTLSVDGHVKLGPTIFPAFSPENYDGLDAVTPSGLT